MQFQVPQFIEVEDKIFGPLTFKQFVYIAGGAALCYLIYRALPLYIAALPILAIAGGAFVFAFIEVNKKPFIQIVESAFYFGLRDKLYLWHADYASTKKKDEKAKAPVAQSQLPSLSENKLKNLAWSLDINERLGADRAREERGVRTLHDDIQYSE
jgi:hypothetical protein